MLERWYLCLVERDNWAQNQASLQHHVDMCCLYKDLNNARSRRSM
jgi:hypothetical protein